MAELEKALKQNSFFRYMKILYVCRCGTERERGGGEGMEVETERKTNIHTKTNTQRLLKGGGGVRETQRGRERES